MMMRSSSLLTISILDLNSIHFHFIFRRLEEEDFKLQTQT